jgi:hypothetical protein
MRDMMSYMRANPQVAVLLAICLVLGLGTFIVVLISIATSGGQNTGDPDDSMLRILHAALSTARLLSAHAV